MSDPHRPVDCQRLVELLGDYVDEQLPPEQRSAVDAHMGQCAPCMAFLKQYRFAPQIVRDWLTTYTMITTGMKAAPEWTHPFYSSAMIGIRSVQQGIEYARAMAQRRAIDNARGVHG